MMWRVIVLLLLALAPSEPSFAACNIHHPCLAIMFTPSAPVEKDTIPVGSVITTITVIVSPSSAGPFHGTLSFGPPPPSSYGNDSGLLALSGSDLVLVRSFPPGTSVQHATVVAAQ